MFKVGDSVEIKKAEPGLVQSLDMKGWRGVISLIIDDEEKAGEELLWVQWDNETLKKMPSDFIRKFMKDKCPFDALYIPPKEVSKIEDLAPFDEEERKQIIKACEKRATGDDPEQRAVNIWSELAREKYDLWRESVIEHGQSLNTEEKQLHHKQMLENIDSGKIGPIYGRLILRYLRKQFPTREKDAEFKLPIPNIDGGESFFQYAPIPKDEVKDKPIVYDDENDIYYWITFYEIEKQENEN